MKKLFKKRKYLRTIFNSHIPLKDGQHLLHKVLEKTDNNISTPRLCFTYNKAYNLAPHKVKTRTPSKKRYKICQIKATSTMSSR